MKILLEKALLCRKNCKCKYSHFPVSVALATRTGNIYTGVNIENVSYGLSMCAERVAIFKAISEGEKITEMVIVTPNGETPCGACRQVMAEYMSPHTAVYVYNDEEELKLSTTIEQLLPYKFDM